MFVCILVSLYFTLWLDFTKSSNKVPFRPDVCKWQENDFPKYTWHIISDTHGEKERQKESVKECEKRKESHLRDTSERGSNKS
jgi:hypothetical protein